MSAITALARHRAMTLLLASALATPVVAGTAPQSVQTPLVNQEPANPWAKVAPDLFANERAPSPFDAMDAVQLAALAPGQRIHWNAPSKCVPTQLRSVLAEISERYGPVTVNSTVRSSMANRRAGGKPKSMHLHCRAIDFRVHGSTKGLTSWLAKNSGVGGYKRYKSGFYHIDNGPKRAW